MDVQRKVARQECLKGNHEEDYDSNRIAVLAYMFAVPMGVMPIMGTELFSRHAPIVASQILVGKYDYSFHPQLPILLPQGMFNLSIHFTKGNAMNMGQAISSCFSKYATFSGRASRSEYWYFYLFYVIIRIVTLIVDGTQYGTFGIIVSLAFFLPGLAAVVRRLHDVGKSGWFILIPFYGVILLFFPSEGDNKYGSAS